MNILCIVDLQYTGRVAREPVVRHATRQLKEGFRIHVHVDSILPIRNKYVINVSEVEIFYFSIFNFSNIYSYIFREFLPRQFFSQILK